jgi:hypothetical protein
MADGSAHSAGFTISRESRIESWRQGEGNNSRLATKLHEKGTLQSTTFLASECILNIQFAAFSEDDIWTGKERQTESSRFADLMSEC